MTTVSHRDLGLNDRELVAGLRQQDTAAVKHLSEWLLPSVWRFVYFRVKGDRHLAEDIVSDTILALIKYIATPENEVLCATTWMRGVALHKIQDHYRAVARVQHLIDQANSNVGTENSSPPQQQEEANERRATIRKVMDDMSEPHRLVLEWKYIDRISVRQIADRMGLTEKAAEAVLYRARREFRTGLGDLHREDVPFRLNGTTNQIAKKQMDNRQIENFQITKQENEGRPPVNGRAGGDIPVSTEVQQAASFDEQKQR